MRLADFFSQAIKLGAAVDPRRGRKINGYADSAILYGDPNCKVARILVGIDMEPAELLLAERIRESQGLDLVISHHPEGKAYAALDRVMQLQVDILASIGVSRSVAQKLLDQRRQEVERRILPQNHTRAVDVARLLGIPFICLHTPADNHAYWFISRLIREKKPGSLKDVIRLLEEIPEYKQASQINAGPRIILGNPNRKLGKVLVEMTGGTEGPKDIFGKLYKTGVRTLVSMHLGEEHFKKVKDANLNVVIAGHISSDTLGLNLLLDRLEKKARQGFQVIGCSGFQRIRRI